MSINNEREAMADASLESLEGEARLVEHLLAERGATMRGAVRAVDVDFGVFHASRGCNG